MQDPTSETSDVDTFLPVLSNGVRIL